MTDAYAQPDNQSNKQEETRRIRTIWISIIIGFLFALISALLYMQGAGKLAANIWGLSVTVTLSLTSIASAWLASRGRATFASILLLASILLISLVTPIIGHGQGVAIGILVAILGIGITAATLPAQYSVRGNTVSLLTGAIIIFLDQTLPDFGFYTEPIYTNIVALVLSTIFIIVIARQFNEFTLRAKLIISFAIITIIPLVILGVYNNYITTRTLTNESHERLSALADSVAKRYDDFFVEQQNDVLAEAKQTALTDYLLLPPQDRPNSVEKNKAEITLLTFQRKDPVFVNSYTILDTTGKNVLDTSAEHIGDDESVRIYFTEVVKTGAPFASDVLFIGNTEKSIYFSAPIKDPANRIIGVLVREYRAIVLQNIARAIAPDDPNVIISIVGQNTYLRLAYTGNRDRLFKSYKDFNKLEVIALQSEGKLPPGKPEEIIAGADEKITTGIDNIDKSQFFDAYSGSLASDSINTGKKLKTQPWIALVRESYTSNLKAIQDQTRNTVLISLALAGIAILLALGGAQVLASPLVSLTKVAEQIASGDISARANINTLDEIGALSASFNRMTDQLNVTLNSLEEHVSERTTDLETAQRQSEKRANELEAISEISKIISSEQKIEILLPLISRLVSERFGFYHTGIFLIEETGQFAVLQAANSEGGRRMLARGHKLELGQGIVGYVAKTGVHRIALDVGLDSVYFTNADLPNTRSEMALPLTIRNQSIGALDVQSEKSSAFSESDAKNLSILADQISIAIENAQLFERTQQALNEMQALYRQNLRENWLTFSREESMVGYHQTMKGGAKVTEPVETDDIRQAINRGATLFFNASGDSEEPSVVVPIKLRGQVIGTLKIKAPDKDRQWTNDETNLIESISERLSIALENARLIQESQRQVIKQQTIRDMTEKISTSINLKNVLQIAVEELGRVIPGSEVVLKLTSKDEQNG
jgi:GAF domain-containing protein/HAMP domain-containing protein